MTTRIDGETQINDGSIRADKLYVSDASTPGAGKFYGNEKWETPGGGGADVSATDVLVNGGTVGTSGVGVIAIANGTEPTSSPAGEVQLFAKNGPSTTTSIPFMTSNTAPSGTVFGTPSAFDAGHDYYYAFRDNSSGSTPYFTSSASSTATLGYHFTSGLVIIGYAIAGQTDQSTWNPQDWTFEGSNDGSAWTTLDSQHVTSWPGSTLVPFSITNSTSYTYYRVNISANLGGTYTALKYLQMFVAGTSALYVRDEAGSVTLLSPHDMSGLPSEIVGKNLTESDGLAWVYRSSKNGRDITVDMYRLAKLVQDITGERLIYITSTEEIS